MRISDWSSDVCASGLRMAWSAIAFDLATTTGWAWHAEGMPGPYFDAFTLPGDPGDVGKPAAALEEWLRIIYRRTKEEGVPITHWFFEAQHARSKTTITTL